MTGGAGLQRDKGESGRTGRVRARCRAGPGGRTGRVRAVAEQVKAGARARVGCWAGLGERERGGAGPRGLREAGARAGRLCGGSVRAGLSGKEEFGFLGRVFLLFFLG